MTMIDIGAGEHSACAPSPACEGGRGGGSRLRMTTPRGAPDAIAFGAANWLSLAAAPTFAIMALLTGVLGGQPDVLCATLQGASPLSGMVPMYLLMSAFHLGPWLKLISGRRADAHAIIRETSRARPPSAARDHAPHSARAR
jgi:hypothetical protein